MKITVNMMDVLNVMHNLEAQNDQASNETLISLKNIFASLIEDSKKHICPPTYELDVLDNQSNHNGIKNEIDWEQRRYEIAKSAMHAYISHNKWDKFAVVRMAIQDADKLIAELKRTSTK